MSPELGPQRCGCQNNAALVCRSDVHAITSAIGDISNLTPFGHDAVGIVAKPGSHGILMPLIRF